MPAAPSPAEAAAVSDPRAVPPLITVAQPFARAVARAWTRRTWSGLENLPASGGALIVCNHLSVYDPIAVGDALLTGGVPPRFLAKETLFDVPLLGAALRATGQIPVARGPRTGARASSALDAAQDAIGRGEIVAMFPEGTLTRDPELWPMRARLGAARIALATGAPVIPAALWGTREVWPYGARRPHVPPRRDVRFSVGRPFRITAADGETEREAVIRGTAEIMEEIVALVAQIRGLAPPAELHDPRIDAFRPEEGHSR